MKFYKCFYFFLRSFTFFLFEFFECTCASILIKNDRLIDSFVHVNVYESSILLEIVVRVLHEFAIRFDRDNGRFDHLTPVLVRYSLLYLKKKEENRERSLHSLVA